MLLICTLIQLWLKGSDSCENIFKKIRKLTSSPFNISWVLPEPWTTRLKMFPPKMKAKKRRNIISRFPSNQVATRSGASLKIQTEKRRNNAYIVGVFGENWRGSLTSSTFLFIWSLATLGDKGGFNLTTKHPGKNRTRTAQTGAYQKHNWHWSAGLNTEEVTPLDRNQLFRCGHKFEDSEVKVWAGEDRFVRTTNQP